MRRFGLIGRPLGHSASAAYFTAKFEREGIADCAYALYELPEIGALPRLLADVPVTAEWLAGLGHGGLCLNCPECHFPNCGFGKGV